MLGERIESIGPHLGVDDPVAQALRVVAAQVEPAVVEHKALHAHLRGQIGERDERGLVVVEIHRLPRVERHQAVAAHMVRQRAQPAVEARGHAVEAVVGPREAHLRRGVVGAGQQLDLAGPQQLARTEQRLVLRQVVEPVGLVAAPRQMARPDLAGVEQRFAVARDEQPRAFMARLAMAAVARHRTTRQRAGLRLLFARPAAGELRQMVGAARDRQHGVEPVHGERLLMLHVDVGDALVHEHQAAFGEAQPHVELHKVDGVLGMHEQLMATVRHLRLDRGPAHEHRRGAAVCLEPGAPGEGLGALRQQ